LIVRICLLLLLLQPLILMAGPISLWRIDHCDATVYILGSIHAVKPDFYPLPAAIDSAFDKADRVIFEVDLQRINDVSLRKLVNTMGIYPPEQNLANQLSTITLKLLREYLLIRTEENIDPSPLTFSNVQQMRPWYLSLVLGMHELQAAGYDPRLGIDQHYFDLAQQHQKPTGSLETAEAQILLLAADSPEVQDLSLKSTLKGVANLKIQLKQMIETWQQGDVEAMLNLSVEADGDDPLLDEQFKRLINDRNMQMLIHIQGYLALSETTLVVVGALHLGGEQGLLNLLRQDHAVTQIDTDVGIASQHRTSDTYEHQCSGA
jgi:hypothetical protein